MSVFRIPPQPNPASSPEPRGGPASLPLRGAGAILAIQVSGIGLAFVNQLILARWLGAEGLGVYSLTTSWAGLGATVALFGLEVAAVRFVGGYLATSRLARLARFRAWANRRLGIVSAVVVCAAIVACLLERSETISPLQILLGAAILVMLAQIRWYQAVMLGARRYWAARTPEQVVRPLGFLILLGATIPWVGRASAEVFLTYQVVVLGIIAGVWPRLARPPGEAVVSRLRPREVREWALVSLPLGATATLRILLAQGDLLLVGSLLGAEAAGLYAVPARLAAIVSLGLAGLSAATAPVAANSWARQDREALRSVARSTARYATAMAVATTLAFGLAGRTVLGMFGEEFVAGYPVLLVLAAGLIVNAATGPVGWLLNITGSERANLAIFAACSLPAALIGWWATVHYGVVGAAAVAAGLTATKNGLTWLVVRRRLGFSAGIV